MSTVFENVCLCVTMCVCFSSFSSLHQILLSFSLSHLLSINVTFVCNFVCIKTSSHNIIALVSIPVIPHWHDATTVVVLSNPTLPSVGDGWGIVGKISPEVVGSKYDDCANPYLVPTGGGGGGGGD